MSRERYVFRNGQCVPIGEADALPSRYGVRLGDGPMVISDAMPAALHMASGKTHESKSSFRRDTKSYGCIELGNDAPKERGRGNAKLPKPHADIAQAWEQLSASR